jgi:hypothetical protein
MIWFISRTNVKIQILFFSIYYDESSEMIIWLIKYLYHIYTYKLVTGMIFENYIINNKNKIICIPL